MLDANPPSPLVRKLDSKEAFLKDRGSKRSNPNIAVLDAPRNHKQRALAPKRRCGCLSRKTCSLTGEDKKQKKNAPALGFAITRHVGREKNDTTRVGKKRKKKRLTIQGGSKMSGDHGIRKLSEKQSKMEMTQLVARSERHRSPPLASFQVTVTRRIGALFRFFVVRSQAMPCS